MSLILSQYDIDENGNANRINFWLKLHSWTPVEAALLFLDIEPNSIPDNDWTKVEFLSGQYSEPTKFDMGIPASLIDSETGKELQAKTKLEEIGIDNLRRQMLDYVKILDAKESRSPHDWIYKALDKSIDIPWIGHAVRHQLVSLPESLTKGIHAIFDTSSPEYSAELDWTIRAWLYAVNNPNRQKPKARMRNYLATKSPLSNNAIDRACQGANWEKLGGAPKTGQNN